MGAGKGEGAMLVPGMPADAAASEEAAAEGEEDIEAERQRRSLSGAHRENGTMSRGHAHDSSHECSSRLVA